MNYKISYKLNYIIREHITPKGDGNSPVLSSYSSIYLY